MHGDDDPKLGNIAIHFLPQISSSSISKRNWSTYSFIYSIKKHILTSIREEKLVVDSALRLEHTKTPKYLKVPTTWWDVDPKDDAQLDEGPPRDLHKGLSVGPFTSVPHSTKTRFFPFDMNFHL